MAALDALDDPLDPTGAAVSGYIDPSASALDGGEDAGAGEDIGGATQEAPLPPNALAMLADMRANMRPAPRGSNRERLQQQIFALQEKLSAPKPTADLDALRMGGGELQYAGEGKPQPKPDEGLMAVIGRGLLRTGEDTQQGLAIAQGEKPKTSKVAPAEFEKPLEWSDLTDPGSLTKKVLFSVARSAPELVGSLIGGAVGTAAGSAVPVVGNVAGGVIGAGLGAGIPAALQAIGPAYAGELEQTPDDPDGAWDRALVTAGKSGAISGASMALFGAGKPLGNILKGLFTSVKPEVAAARVAAGATAEEAAKPVAGLPLRIGVQAVGQPAVAAGGEVGANLIEGKPAGTGVVEAMPGAISNVAIDALTHGIARGYRAFRGKPGVDAAEESALVTGQQLELPLTGGQGEAPPRVGPTGQVELPLPGGAGERPPVQGEQLELPGIRPGRQPLGDVVPPPTGPAPVQGELPLAQQGELPGGLPGVGRRPPGAAPPEGGPPDGGPPPGGGGGGGQGELPLGPSPPGPVGGPQLELPTAPTQTSLPLRSPEAPVARPGGAQPELPGIGEAQQRPAIQPSLPVTEEPLGPRAPIDAAERPIGAVPEPPAPTPSERGPLGPSPVGAGGRTPEGWLVEPDHTGPGHVVKNADGTVIAVGDTPQQAVEFARARDAKNTAPIGSAAEEVGSENVRKIAPAPDVTQSVEARVAEILARDYPDLPPEAHAAVTKAVREKLEGAEKAPTTPVTEGVTEGVTTPVSGTELSAPSPSPKGEEVKAKAAAAKAERQAAADATKAKIAAKAAAAKEQTEADTTSSKRTKSGAFSGGEGPDVTSELKTKTPPTSTSTPVSRGARAEMDALSGKGRARGSPQPVTPRPPAGSNKDRIGNYLIDEVLAGRKTLDEARADYGEQAPVGERPGQPGRPRSNPTLAEHVREMLKRADDPAVAAQLRAELENLRVREQAEAERARQNLARDPKVKREIDAAQKRIIELLDRDARAKANRDALEDILRDLEGERGTPVEPAESLSEDMPTRVTRTTAAYKAARPEVNEPVLRRLDSGGGKLRDFLDDLINDRMGAALAPQHAMLAKVLRRILPNLDVVERDLGDRVLGHYDPATGELVLNAKALRANRSAGAMTTLLHEALHAATLDYVNVLFKVPEVQLSPRMLAHKTALRAISDEIYRVVNDHNIPMSDTARRATGYMTREYEGGALHEIITQAFTHPEVIDVLSRTPASRQLKTVLDSVGMGSRGVSSMWDGFKRVLRHIFGLPGNDSILDHIFRPLSEIVEVGPHVRAEVSKIIKSNAEVLERPITERTVLSEENLRRAGEAATNILDPTKGRLLRANFVGSTLDAIHNYVKPYFQVGDRNLMTEHRAAREAVTHATDLERARDAAVGGVAQPNIDRVLRLNREIALGPDGDKLGKLMTDATLNEAHLDPSDPFADNSHLVTPEQTAKLAELQATFNNLDPQAKQTYRETRDLHREWYKREREAGLEAVLRYSLPEATAAQIDAVRQQMRTAAGVAEIINRPDATSVARQFGGDWGNKKALINEIAELQKAGFVQGDYFPLRRYGDYVVSYGRPNTPSYGVEMFETRSKADTRRAELVAGNATTPGRTDVSQVFNKALTRPQSLFRAPEQALGPLETAMTRAGLSEQAQASLRDLYVGQLLQQGTRMATRSMRREGVTGASTDQARHLLNDFLGYTGRMGHLLHGGEVTDSLYRMEKHADTMRQAGSTTGENAARASRLAVEELRQRIGAADGDNSADVTGRAARGLTSTSFLYNLMRPAHYMVQLLDTYSTAASMLGARHKFGALGALNRALGQLSGTAGKAGTRNLMAAMRGELRSANWDMSELYRTRLKAAGMHADHVDLLIDRLNQAGLIDHTQARELRRMGGPQGFSVFGHNNPITRAMDMFGAGEHAMDSMTRTAIAKAAFELELSKSHDVNTSLDYAMQMARDTQPNYNLHNKSRLTTGRGVLGRLAAPIMQYKSYGLHMYGVQGNLIVNAYRAAKNSSERSEALAALGLLQGSHALLSGVATSVFGSLPMMVGMGLYDYFGTDAKRPHTNAMVETQARNWVHDNLGKTASEVFANGIPSALGVDMHRSLQFSNLLGVPELRSFDNAGYAELVFKAVTGASGDTAESLAGATKQILGGDMRGIPKLMPRIVGDPIQGYNWATEGVKTAKGDITILPPGKVSTIDAIVKGLGGNPQVVSDAREARSAIGLVEEVSHDVKGAIIDRLARAAPAERKPYLEEIGRYNKANPTDPITGQAIQSRLMEQARANAMPGLYGAHVPKSHIGSATQVGRFAS